MEVKWYSGYKGEEKPRAFIVNGKEYQINKVLHEELMENSLTQRRKRIFLVETKEGIYKLMYDGSDWLIIKEK